MNDTEILDIPEVWDELQAKSKSIGFTMDSDLYIGTLLKTLITSKPKSNLLELGTGISLTLSWMIAGMDAHSKLISLDNDPALIAIASDYFGSDPRVEILCVDGGEWLLNYEGPKFDLIFADTWPGKYFHLEETLELVAPGGFYVIDDMTPASDWPEGHQEKADQLMAYLESREEFNLTKMSWSTGIVIATKKH